MSKLNEMLFELDGAVYLVERKGGKEISRNKTDRSINIKIIK